MCVPVNVVMNWSSGKDAALACHLLQQDDAFRVSHLLTTISQNYDRVFMHGTREQLLDMQAQRMGLPLLKIKLPAHSDDSVYQQAMQQHLQQLKTEGVTTAAYGDIFLEDLRAYREQQLAQIGLQALFPLWKKDARELIGAIEDAGIEAIIICVNDRYLGSEYLGRKINRELLYQLPDNVDACGENGEFHTFVSNAPFFSSPIPVATGEIVRRTYNATKDNEWDTGFYFLDIIPV